MVGMRMDQRMKMSHTSIYDDRRDVRAALSVRDREFARRLAEALARRRKALQNFS